MKPAELQKEIRLRAARIIATAGSSHIGGVFSCADILAILYGEILARTDAGFIDSFILSKGHCCAGVYSALNALGYLSNELLGTYAQDGSPLMAHISQRERKTYLRLAKRWRIGRGEQLGSHSFRRPS